MRKLKLAFLHAARALGGFRIARTLTAKGVRVLCYHGVWMGDRRFAGDCMFIGAETFARRLDWLAEAGYPVLRLDDAAAALREGRELPAGATVITIDDGWYGTYASMAPALKARRMPATLYCDTAQLTGGHPIYHVMARYIHLAAGWPELDPETRRQLDAAADPTAPIESRKLACERFAAAIGVDIEALVEARAFSYMTPSELAAMYGEGYVDVQLHTHNHTMHDLGHAAIAREVETNAEVLAGILGTPASRFRHFCYPSGVTSPAAEIALERLGIASSTTTSSGLAYPGTRMQAVPRFLDGENVFQVEFEAEMSGFMDLVRSGLARLRGLKAGFGVAPVTAASRQA